MYWFWNKLDESYIAALWSNSGQSCSDMLCQSLRQNKKISLLFMCVSLGMHFNWKNGLILCYRKELILSPRYHNTQWYTKLILYFKFRVVEIVFFSGIKTSTGVLSQMENLTTPVWLCGLLRHHAGGSVLGIGRTGTGGCLGSHALHKQCVTPGSSAKHSLCKLEEATSFSCAPGPSPSWKHRCVTYIRWGCHLKFKV